MLRINKASEYGVLALTFISQQAKALSAREISDGLQLPYEITAKTLQRLKEAGFIESSLGTNGGYRLRNTLSDISFAQIIDALEGPVALVECTEHRAAPTATTPGTPTKECARYGHCGMQSGMQKLNIRMRELLESVKLSELTPTAPTVEQKEV